MKAIKTTFFIIFSISMYAQNKPMAFVNSGAISKNLNCGIGEIFVIPITTEEKQKLLPNKDTDNSQNLDLTASPNPTSGIIDIKTDRNIKIISIFSPEGRWLMDVDVSRDKRIDLGNLPAGLYTLVTREPNCRLIKIIKK